jgi:hypothetical protein
MAAGTALTLLALRGIIGQGLAAIINGVGQALQWLFPGLTSGSFGAFIDGALTVTKSAWAMAQSIALGAFLFAAGLEAEALAGHMMSLTAVPDGDFIRDDALGYVRRQSNTTASYWKGVFNNMSSTLGNPWFPAFGQIPLGVTIGKQVADFLSDQMLGHVESTLQAVWDVLPY